jgi:hypothetical protein
MATQIRTSFGEGQANITEEHGGQARLANALRDGIDDITELRTQLIALLAKLDLDTGVADENYATLLTPADQTLTKG